MTAPCVDESLLLLGRALRAGRLSQWERGFAVSILGHAKRGGPAWTPTPKQARTLRNILAAARAEAEAEAAGDDGPELIDHHDAA